MDAVDVVDTITSFDSLPFIWREIWGLVGYNEGKQPKKQLIYLLQNNLEYVREFCHLIASSNIPSCLVTIDVEDTRIQSSTIVVLNDEFGKATDDVLLRYLDRDRTILVFTNTVPDQTKSEYITVYDSAITKLKKWKHVPYPYPASTWQKQLLKLVFSGKPRLIIVTGWGDREAEQMENALEASTVKVTTGDLIDRCEFTPRFLCSMFNVDNRWETIVFFCNRRVEICDKYSVYRVSGSHLELVGEEGHITRMDDLPPDHIPSVVTRVSVPRTFPLPSPYSSSHSYST